MRSELDSTLVQGAGERLKRFPEEYRAIEILIDSLNQIIQHHREKRKVRTSGPERDLDLLVASSFGKAGKTFQGVNTLCAFGFGEDALILVRANINLMINLCYVLADDSLSRCADFVAYSHTEHAKYLKTAHDTVPAWYDTLDWDEIEKRDARWRSVSIKERAKRGRQKYHYEVGYAFYSSLDHSDAVSLSRYIAPSDERGLRIESGPADKYVGIALHHNFWVMANILFFFCSHFDIVDPDIFTGIDKEWVKLARVGQGEPDP